MLAPGFIGPYKVTKRVEKLPYQVELPTELAGVHNVFHVSHLRKCLHKTATLGEPNHLLHISMEPITLVPPTASWSIELGSFVTKKLGRSDYNGEKTQ